MRSGIVTLAALVLACSEATRPVDPGPALLAEESRYRVVSESDGSVLTVRVEATGGWHIAPEAPAKLDLTVAGARVEPAALRAEHARELTEDVIEWGCQVLPDGSGGDVDAAGQLKFGICEGPKEKCVIIRREIEIPL